MHTITYAIRQIAAEQLPTVRDDETGEQRAATPAELLNMGIQHISEDFYSCCEQINSDDDRDIVEIGGRLERRWQHVGIVPAGVTVTAGPDRYARLPADVKPRILRAEVIRGTEPGQNALAIVEANLLEQQATIFEFVGDIERAPGTVAPLVDFEAPSAIVAEGRRLAGIPDNGIERMNVPMIDVAGDSDVVAASNIIPQVWAGERVR